MKKEWYSKFSQCLNRDMAFNVYGHAGKPILVFPSQNGRYFDFENNGMVDCIAHLIEDGKVQLFCCDSIDEEGWSNENGFGPHRTYMIEQFYYYIVHELVPLIEEINTASNGGVKASGIFTTGCSMGATHAANFMFRRPDIFDGTIALSGYYDSDLFFKGYFDEILYNNSPCQFIHGMSQDHPYVELYKKNKIILCCGQGAWEDDMIRSSHRMKELLDYKGIPAWIDFWGFDVNHDWPWWRIQLPYFLERVV